MFKYSINLAWSNEDSCYVATVTEFPGLSAFGESPEVAVAEAKIAVKGFLEIYKEDGCEIPEPDTLRSFSGQTRLRLPRTLHATLNQEAQKEGVSLNTYLVNLLSERNVSRQVRNELSELRILALSTAFQSVDNEAGARSDLQNSFFDIDIDQPQAVSITDHRTSQK